MRKYKISRDKNGNIRLVRPSDIIIIVVLLLAIIAINLPRCIDTSQPADLVVIRMDGEIANILPLDVDNLSELKKLDHQVTTQKNTIKIKDGKVHMSFASCPDQVCVRQGEISQRGETIVCLPSHMSVTIISSDELDGLAGIDQYYEMYGYRLDGIAY